MLLEELCRFIQDGGTNLSRAFHLNRPGRQVENALGDRPTRVDARKDDLNQKLYDTIRVGDRDTDPYTGLVVGRDDVETRDVS